MALNVTIGSNGRISKGTNVVIPKENAGIGDCVYGTRDDHIIIQRGTRDGSNVNGKSIYGAIFGFVDGQAMIVAPDCEDGKAWGSHVSGMPTLGAGNIRLRNGNAAQYFAAMNMARTLEVQSNFNGSAVHPTGAWQGYGLMSRSTFDSSTAAQQIYGSGAEGYNNYLKQVLRVNGAPGTIFGMTATDANGNFVKVHEFGRWFGKTYGNISTSYALGRCYNYKEGGGTWWLPSMFELAELMVDEHLDLVNENGGSGWTDVSRSSYRWSCCLSDSSDAWAYDSYGMSSYNGLSYEFMARPVTLLKL